jgi:hypothetical protein
MIKEGDKLIFTYTKYKDFNYMDDYKKGDICVCKLSIPPSRFDGKEFIITNTKN